MSQTRLQPQVEEAEARRRSELLSPQVPGEPKLERSGSPSWREPTRPMARSQPRGCTRLLPLISLASFIHSTLATLGPRCSTRLSPVAARGAYLTRGMRPLSSPPREGTPVPCIGRRILTHRTTREVLHAASSCRQPPHTPCRRGINTGSAPAPSAPDTPPPAWGDTRG